MEPGTLVAERFEIEREAGSGGMGTVYRARDRHRGEIVALKLLRSVDPRDLARFTREARTLAALHHPGIVRYVDHGVAPGGDVWLAMEWLEGEGLDRRLRRGLRLDEALEIALGAAEALAPAHRRGVIHRDLKPGNLFLVGGDPKRVKVIDFGIARALGAETRVTTTGTAVGTPNYMSPEQARGAQELDCRTDVYSLGCVLYEMLCGEPPFCGDSAIAVLAKILLEQPRPLRDRNEAIPAVLDALVLRLLAKDPQERPANAAALVEALGQVEAAALAAGSVRPGPMALGEEERRLVCVVLVPAPGGGGARTLPASPASAGAGLGRIRDRISALGGKLEVLAEGSLIATVPSRGVATDQAARAARCALAIRELLPHEPVVLVAGRGVVTSRLPIGDVIDRGVRILEGEERPETPGVRIDEVIGSLLDERFSIVKEGEARYLVGVGGGGQVADTLLGKRVPCVGRKRELGALLALLEESAEEPVARAVLVTAPAGGGKSRLASEFLMALGRLEEPPLILFGRGDPMREGSPFSAMARAIRFEAGIVEGEPVALQHRKLELRLESSLEESELPGVSRFLAELIRAPYDDASDELLAARQDPRLMADAIHDALERWLRAECALRPVLLVFDDMSWGDRPTMEALDELLRRLEQAPLMVLALARPDLHDRFGQLWRDRDVQELRLARLTRGACARLVRAVLGELPEPTLERMIERSEGNPFYLEELIRAVAQDGEADLPESVLAMVEARLDALNPEGRRVLRACSVFGQSCWTEGVERLLGDNHSVREWIEGLSAEELLVRVEAQALAEKEEWRFRSEVVREAAYATLTEEDRRLGHRLAGEWLEAAGSADAVMLAEHFDRGGAGSKAATHYLRAAEHALEANDYGAAGQRAERGVEAGASPLTLGGLRLVQAEGHRWTGDYEGAASFAEQAVQLLPEGSARWYQALGNLLLSAGHRGDVQEMRRWTERALRSEPLEGARVAKVICLCRGSHQELGAGNLAEADTLVEAVQREVGALGVADPVASAWLHTTRASCSLRAGGLGAYIEGTAAAARAYELAGDLRHACNQRVRLGYGYAEVGDYARAERELRAALGQAQRLGLVLVQGYALQNLGSVLANQARFEEAREVEAQALAIAQRVDDAPLEGGCHFYLSVIAERQGDPETAERRARQAERILVDSAPLKALADAMIARALLGKGEPDQARPFAQASVEVIRSLEGMEEGEALIWLASAETLLANGELEAAHRALGSARRRLLERADRIADPALRASFLERVPDHARTLALAAEHGVEA